MHARNGRMARAACYAYYFLYASRVACPSNPSLSLPQSTARCRSCTEKRRATSTSLVSAFVRPFVYVQLISSPKRNVQTAPTLGSSPSSIACPQSAQTPCGCSTDANSSQHTDPTRSTSRRMSSTRTLSSSSSAAQARAACPA